MAHAHAYNELHRKFKLPPTAIATPGKNITRATTSPLRKKVRVFGRTSSAGTGHTDNKRFAIVKNPQLNQEPKKQESNWRNKSQIGGSKNQITESESQIRGTRN